MGDEGQTSRPVALIIGAGPAGLTAAYELLDRTDVTPIVFEATHAIGGISQTVDHGGNRIDIGGHRFFSKSARVMAWWQNILPLQGAPASDDLLLGRTPPLAAYAPQRAIRARRPSLLPGPDPATTDRVLLVRHRVSRILFLGRFFDYPLSLSRRTVANLGSRRLVRIVLSYLASVLRPVRPERSLEDFMVNRFGRELYRTFFRDYTLKLWGQPASRIKPEWGAQRIKGLSITKALLDPLRKWVDRGRSVDQQGVETSLITRFFYPKLGPGQLWEEVAERVVAAGGTVRRGQRVVQILHRDGRVTGVVVQDQSTGRSETVCGDCCISSMPVRDLVAAMGDAVPPDVRSAASGLQYRDFVTVGVLARRLLVRCEAGARSVNGLILDNWVYVQEPDVRMLRVQIFNNWSPYLVRDPSTVWLGLEYTCDQDDGFWGLADGEIRGFALCELEKIGFVAKEDVLDAVVIRVPKAYPGYFGSYDQLGLVRAYLDPFENLFLVGRNGMHRYNNADHSMLSAMAAVDAIASGETSKDAVWSVNADREYHEGK